MTDISVLMSVYNGELFLKESIDSILNQTYEDFELIIIDDGSTDRTSELIHAYSDPRIRSFRFQENRGVGAALQFGLNQTTGKYIAKADADDINHPARLAKQKLFLDEHPDVTVVKSLFRYFPHNAEMEQSERYKEMKSFRENFKNSVRSIDELREKLYWTCCVAHTTIMGRADALKKVGYDPNLRITEDYKLVYELNKQGYVMDTIHEVLVDVRVSKHSTTVQEDAIFLSNVYRIKQEEIKKLSQEGNRFFLWGAGSQGEYLVQHVLPVDEIKIFGFIDSDTSKQNKRVLDFPVYSPDILNKGDTVLITSQPGLYAIGEELKKKGFLPLRDFIGFY